MEQRGRKSLAGLSVVPMGIVATIPRPDAPEALSEAQAEIWRTVVNRLEADHFPPETHGDLCSYCEHTDMARYLAALIQRCREDAGDVDELDKLLKMHERETRAASSLATRMRMTQQATMNAKTKKPAMTLPKPWERK